MRLPVFFSRVSSSATGTNRPGQCAKAVGSNVSKRACSFHSLRACRRYSALQSCWSKPKPARMRVSVAVPTTVKEPKAWRKARRKLRSCRNTGRQSETKARKRVSNTAGWSWFYFYQGSIPLHQSPIENVQTPGSCRARQEPGVTLYFMRRMSTLPPDLLYQNWRINRRAVRKQETFLCP